ncbi:phosphomannomutase/phosphoglucomutase [Asaia bogorensis]|uniref:phosphomannomutase/phosphoglucomutase n=1 Tax=Asaia bogorensis TaxID=91915 RepID=UPI0038CF4597
MLFRHEFHPTILREYDIRGIVGKTLGEDDARALGVVFASGLCNGRSATILVGHDGRLTSPALETALVEGLITGGATVRRIGCCPTPQLYHASCRHEADGAIMITGSHNPLDYNGFKIVQRNRPVFGQGLLDLANLLRAGITLNDGAKGEQDRLESAAGYVDALRAGLRTGRRPLKVVWDNSHSSAGDILAALIRTLPGRHIVLNGEIDGRFPAHHPDPSLPEAMVQLQTAVCQHGADLGVAFDGDADRLGVVDEQGTVIAADRLSLLLAQSILRNTPGATVLGDVKMSRIFFEGIERAGGKGLMCPSGHSHVKNALRETGAVFAGEMSGHFFFADNWPGFDDGLYAAIRMIDLLSQQTAPLSALVASLPHAVSTPEIRFDCPDDQKFNVINAVIAQIRERDMGMTLIDGVRVDEATGWWLLRASNTQPALVARAEGNDEVACRAMMETLAGLLLHSGVAVPEGLKQDIGGNTDHGAGGGKA